MNNIKTNNYFIYSRISDKILILCTAYLIMRMPYSYIFFSFCILIILIPDIISKNFSFYIKNENRYLAISLIGAWGVSLFGGVTDGNIASSYFMISLPFVLLLVYSILGSNIICVHKCIEKGLYIGLSFVVIISFIEFFSDFRLIRFRYPDSSHIDIVGSNYVTSIYPNINDLSYGLILYLSLLSGRLFNFKLKSVAENVFNIVMFQFSLYAGIFLDSRAFLISVVILAFLIFAFLVRNIREIGLPGIDKSVPIVVLMVLLSVGVNIGVSYIPAPNFKYASDVGGVGEVARAEGKEFTINDNSSRTRIRIISNYIEYISNDPYKLFFGFGNLAEYVEVFDENFGEILHDPHNLILELCIGYGLISLLLFVIFYFEVLYEFMFGMKLIVKSKTYVSMVVMFLLLPIISLGPSSSIKYYLFFFVVIYISSYRVDFRKKGALTPV